MYYFLRWFLYDIFSLTHSIAFSLSLSFANSYVVICLFLPPSLLHSFIINRRWKYIKKEKRYKSFPDELVNFLRENVLLGGLSLIYE